MSRTKRRENVSKEYKEVDGQTLKIEIYYDLGGYDNLRGDTIQRGYYASISPVTLINEDGYITERYTAFTGIRKLIHPVKQRSKSGERIAEELFTEETQQSLINHISGKQDDKVYYSSEHSIECKKCKSDNLKVLKRQHQEKWDPHYTELQHVEIISFKCKNCGHSFKECPGSSITIQV